MDYGDGCIKSQKDVKPGKTKPFATGSVLFLKSSLSWVRDVGDELTVTNVLDFSNFWDPNVTDTPSNNFERLVGFRLPGS